jgi:hypothetical protein
MRECEIKEWGPAVPFPLSGWEKTPKIYCEKAGIFRKRRFYPYIIIVTYIGYFFNVFSPDFSIFLIFSYAMSTAVSKTPFWGNFEGKTDPFFVQMG